VKTAKLALSLLLVACTSLPPDGTVSPLKSRNLISPVAFNLPPQIQVPGNTYAFLPYNPLLGASSQVQSRSGRDELGLKVIIGTPGIRTLNLELSRFAYLKAWVKSSDLTTQIDNQEGYKAVTNVGNNTTNLTIQAVPKGKNRIVSVQAYDTTKQAINGGVLKAVYNSLTQDQNDSITLTFNWQSTATANVIEALQASHPELLENLDTAALQTLINNLAFGTNVPNGSNYVFHPSKLDANAIATAIADNNGLIPAYTAGNPIPAGWQQTAPPINIVVRTTQNQPFTNSNISLQITDPASSTNPNAIVTQPTDKKDTGNIPAVIPGTWDAIVKIDGLNGGISQRTTVTVDAAGNVTLGSGTTGNPVVLPPVLKSQNVTNGSSGSTLILTGDGFDPTAASYDVNNPNGQRVLIGGVPAVVTAATATTLIVTVPQGLTGSNLPVTVVNNNKTSNQGSYTVNKAVTALDKPGGKPGDVVILTVSGFKPNETDLTVQFAGSANPVPAGDILEKTATTIKVKVPADAQTGVITVTPSGGTGLTSPTYTINTPIVNAMGPQNGAAPGSQLVLSGANLQGATLVNFSDGNGGQVFANVTNVSADGTSVTVTVPAGAKTGDVTVVATGGNATYQNYPIIQPPTITQLSAVDTSTGKAIVTLTGSNYTSATQVNFAGFNATSFEIISDTEIKAVIPPGFNTGPVTVTNPAGNATSTILIDTFSEVKNFIGTANRYTGLVEWVVFGSTVRIGTAAVPNVEKTYSDFFTYGATANPVIPYVDYLANFSTVNKAVAQPHGITLDSNNNIYTSNLNHTIDAFTNDGTFLWRSGDSQPGMSTTVNAPTPVAGTTCNTPPANPVGTVHRSAARWNTPEDLAADDQGNVYVADTNNHAIRKIDAATGNVTTVAMLLGPEGVDYKDGFLYVSSNEQPNSPTGSRCAFVSKVEVSTGTVTRVAGDVVGGIVNAQGTNARFKHLEGLGLDGLGNIYVGDVENNAIRKIDTAGNVTTFATITQASTGAAANFLVHEIRVDKWGNIFVPGEASRQIFKISPLGAISIIAGTGTAGLQDGVPRTVATFDSPRAVDFDTNQNLYIADTSWGVRKITRFQWPQPAN
jgi:hypothetical protein